MSFVELGSVLRAEREKRGLSLDSVAEHLKISARILRALEEGDESSLPHTVYVRGFVRSYGNYLGLDSEELHEGMTSLSDEEQDVQPVNVYMTPEADSGRGGGKLFLLIFILLCAVGAALFWFYRDADLFSELQQARLSTAQPAPPLNARPEGAGAPQKEGAATAQRAPAPTPQSGQSTPTAPAKPAPQAEQPAQKTQTSTQAGGQQAAQAATQAATAPVASSAAAGQSTAANPAQNTAQSSANQSAAAQAAAAQNAGGQASAAQGNASQSTRDVAPVSGHHKIIITALAECWIHSNADSTDTRQFSLRKGDTFALTFADKLVLKLGNAGGVRIRYNGEDLPQQGKEGQVKTLTFPLAAQ